MVREKEKKNIKEEPVELASKFHLIELEEKSKLADEYLNQMQRLKAEYENYRKRVIKEKEEYRKYVLEDFLCKLLNVIDNIQRAIGVSREDHKFNSLMDGISIVEKQFLDLLKAQGVESIKTNIGDKFDPHLHHAVSHESSKEYPADAITKVLQIGYKIGDRVLRPAMVVVSSGKEKIEEQ